VVGSKPSGSPKGFGRSLAQMRELDLNPQGHFINCSTCHRGSVKPKEQ
jgi:hypothetical protein